MTAITDHIVLHMDDKNLCRRGHIYRIVGTVRCKACSGIVVRMIDTLMHAAKGRNVQKQATKILNQLKMG